MNLDITVSAQISKVALKVKALKDGFNRRICRATFTREFDEEIAEALGKDAKGARKALEAGGLSEVKIPMDAIVVSGKLRVFRNQPNDTVVDIPIMTGVRAVGKTGIDPSPEGEDEPPQIKLEFDFDFLETAWVFLGRHCAVWAELEFRPVQQTLPGVGGANGGKADRHARA